MSGRLFSRALFAGQEGSAFSVTDASGGGPRVMVLDRIENAPSSPGQEQYALFFQVESDDVSPQGTYHLEHEVLGEMDLFLVPIGRTGRTVEYQACFNHLLTSA